MTQQKPKVDRPQTVYYGELLGFRGAALHILDHLRAAVTVSALFSEPAGIIVGQKTLSWQRGSF